MSDSDLVVVTGVDALRPEHGPLFAVIGVFDGLHRGHAYLLERLVEHGQDLDARPSVITFDSHPDEILVGAAPPILLDPDERLDRLAAAGVQVAVVQHFDDALRHTEYDEFIGRITRRTHLAGLLMTPDAAFGYERRGTAEAVTALAARSQPPFTVVVVPPFTIGDRPVSSSEIRRRVLAGDLDGAAELLGRRYSVVGTVDDDGNVRFALPVALPPPGDYGVEFSESSAVDWAHNEASRASRGTPPEVLNLPGRARVEADRQGVRLEPALGREARISIAFA